MRSLKLGVGVRNVRGKAQYVVVRYHVVSTFSAPAAGGTNHGIRSADARGPAASAPGAPISVPVWLFGI